MKTVLVAEDSNLSRSFIVLALEQYSDLRVMEAGDGQEAWELLEEHGSEVDLVLTDLNMPRMSGLELLNRARADRRFAHIPVVMITTEGEAASQVRTAGADAMVTKPVKSGVLHPILDQLLGSAGDAGRVGLLVMGDGALCEGLIAAMQAGLCEEVYRAQTGLEAIGQLFLHDVDLLVIDLDLPNEEAPRLVERLRAGTPYGELPLFLIAGREALQDLGELGNLGATEVVSRELAPGRMVDAFRGAV